MGILFTKHFFAQVTKGVRPHKLIGVRPHKLIGV